MVTPFVCEIYMHNHSKQVPLDYCAAAMKLVVAIILFILLLLVSWPSQSYIRSVYEADPDGKSGDHFMHGFAIFY